MFVNVERYVNFLAKHKLTQTQFLFLYFNYKEDAKSLMLYKKTFDIPKKVSILSDIELQDLKNRKIVTVESVNSFGNEVYIVFDELHRLFFKDIYLVADEIYALYPGFIKIKGNNIPLLTMDRVQFAVLYNHAIGGQFEEHLEVIHDIMFAKENNLINVKIENFVKSQLWLKIREIRKQQVEIKEVEMTDESM